MRVTAVVDGAVFNNGGRGSMGMGAVLQQMKGETVLREREFHWREDGEHVTNNRAELLAIRNVLKFAFKPGLPARIDLTVISDSQWALNGIQGLFRINSHRDLVEEIQALGANFSSLVFEWVKGHDGHALNERADFLAQAAARPGVKAKKQKAVRRKGKRGSKADLPVPG